MKLICDCGASNFDYDVECVYEEHVTTVIITCLECKKRIPLDEVEGY